MFKSNPLSAYFSAVTLGAFGISAAIHVLIFVVVGSIVVFKSPLVSQYFVSEDPTAYNAEIDIEPAIIDELQPLPEFANVETITTEGGTIEDEAATPIDLIISSVPVPTTSSFALPSNVGVSTGTLFGRKSSGDGQGLGGSGNSITATIFGKSIKASNLGVVLDVSGSAHRYLDQTIMEIDKSFPDAHMMLVVGCGMSKTDGVNGKIRGERIVPGKPRVVAYGRRGSEEKYDSYERSAPAQLESFFNKIGPKRSKELREYFSRRNNLYLLYGGDIHAANYAFDYVIDQNVDTIYWFADFADRIDKKVAEDLTKKLKGKGAKVIAHNFLGKPVKPEAKEMAEKTGGTTIELIPGN